MQSCGCIIFLFILFKELDEEMRYFNLDVWDSRKYYLLEISDRKYRHHGTKGKEYVLKKTDKMTQSSMVSLTKKNIDTRKILQKLSA